MKRAWVVAGLVLLASASLLAQIHGTPASVTSLGGFRGGSFSNPPGVRSSVTSLGARGWQNVPCCGARGFRNGFGGSNFASRDGRRFDHHGRFGRDNRFWGFPLYGYPIYGPYLGYVPLYDWSYYDSSYNDPAPQQLQQPYVQPSYDPVVKTDVTIRDERSASAEQAPAATEQASLKQPQPPAAEQDPTVLVFRDGHRLEVHNYAIVGETLFNFDGHGPRRIQLSDLDLDATRKLNDDRGNEFHVPGQ
jgi:hypothetical protein